MKLAMVFPGQGSQSVGMMQAYGDIAAVRAVLDEAADALGQDLGKLMAEGPVEQLNQTVNTQPVMLTAGYAAYRAWIALGGAEPALMAGHSLGEYTALVAAGVLSFRDALPLVRFRAQAMQEAVPQGQGAMAAILGLDEDAVRAACAEAAQGEIVQAVNFNSPGQVVIAGHAAAVKRACDAAKARGAKRALPLLESDPFFVMNADSFWPLGEDRPLMRMIESFDAAVADMVLLCVHPRDATGFRRSHDFCLDPRGRLTKDTGAPVIYSGVALLSRSILERHQDEVFSLYALIERSLEDGRLLGVALDARWFHVGDPAALALAEDMLRS